MVTERRYFEADALLKSGEASEMLGFVAVDFFPLREAVVASEDGGTHITS
jgi:hypothetical protein